VSTYLATARVGPSTLYYMARSKMTSRPIGDRYHIMTFSSHQVPQVRPWFKSRLGTTVLTMQPGILTALATNPIWVIKTRMLSTPSSHAQAYTSMVDGARQILRLEGVRGFYRGLVPSLFGVSHGALQFMAYEQLKIYRGQSKPEGQGTLTAVDFLVLSGAAKVFAGSTTYPYQVIRTRLQMYDADSTYRGASDVVAQVWRKEGIAGFYKGLGPNLLRVLPSTWVTFLVYEKTKLYIPRLLE